MVFGEIKHTSPEDENYPAYYKVADMLGIDYMEDMRERVESLQVGQSCVFENEVGDKKVRVTRNTENNYRVENVK